LTILPWVGLDRISIRFSRDVAAGIDDLSVTGANLVPYPVREFDHVPSTFTETWILSRQFGNDQVILNLDGDAGGVSDAAGLLLDGEWSDGAQYFPSGNGLTGGDFRFQLNVLPGDVNRSGGAVDAGDLSQVRLRQLTSPTKPGTPPDRSYTIFHDVNGSANINALDLGAVRANQLKAPPAGETSAAASLAGDTLAAQSTTKDLFSAAPILA